MSPVAGASVNVSVVPLTLYAVVGSCTTPLILAITPAVVAAAPSVKAVVLSSPSNVSLAYQVQIRRQ